jgi:hypothetical protein
MHKQHYQVPPILQYVGSCPKNMLHESLIFIVLVRNCLFLIKFLTSQCVPSVSKHG